MEITKNNFEAEVINSSVLTIVDYWADWCAPCAMLSPVLSKMEEIYQDKIKLCKVNIDKEIELTLVNKIISVPTLKFYKNGEVINTLIGYHDEAQLKEEIEKML